MIKAIIAFSLLVATCALAQAQAISPLPVNIQSFGAIGDGSSHLLSSRFSTLAAAQAVYPNASDLTQEIDTMAIQAAIDYCANNSTSPSACRRISCPAGRYQISQPIFLDFPHNLRGNNAAWTTGNRPYASGVKVTYNGVPWISLASGNNDTPSESSTLWTVVGATSAGGNTYWSPDFDGFYGLKGGDPPTGCIFNSSFTNDVVFWTFGNGPTIRGVDFRSPTASSVQTCAQPPNGVAIGIAGGGTRAKLENIGIVGFYAGVKTSADGVQTTRDLTELEKSSLIGQCIGVWIAANQNFMNTLVDNEIRAHVDVMAIQNSGVNIYSGNYSGIGTGGGEEAPVNSFSLTGVSVSTSAVANQFQITATLTGGSPGIASDPYLSGAQCTPRNDGLSFSNSLDGCIYNAWSVVTGHWGVVPLSLQSYNQSTHVAVFLIYPSYLWLEANSWGGTGLLQDLQAISTVYAAEMQTTFWGCGVNAEGVHIENAQTATTLINQQCLFGNGRPSHLKGIYLNYDISVLTHIADALPAYYAMQGFPWINIVAGTNDLTLEDFNYEPGGNVNDSVEVDMPGAVPVGGNVAAQFIWKGRALPINVRVSPPTNNGGNFTGGYTGFATLLGGGIYDDASAGSNVQAYDLTAFMDAFRTTGWGKSPFAGVRPAPWSTPCLTTSQISLLATGPTNSNVIGTYPIMWGGQVYRKCDWTLTGQTTFNAVSQHVGWSYGRTMTSADFPGLGWTAAARSPAIYISSNSSTQGDYQDAIMNFFPGLVLNLAACSANPLMITEVHPHMGYVFVTDASSPEGTSHGNGPPVASSCSGNTIGQPAYSVTQF